MVLSRSNSKIYNFYLRNYCLYFLSLVYLGGIEIYQKSPLSHRNRMILVFAYYKCVCGVVVTGRDLCTINSLRGCAAALWRQSAACEHHRHGVARILQSVNQHPHRSARHHKSSRLSGQAVSCHNAKIRRDTRFTTIESRRGWKNKLHCSHGDVSVLPDML